MADSKQNDYCAAAVHHERRKNFWHNIVSPPLILEWLALLNKEKELNLLLNTLPVSVVFRWYVLKWFLYPMCTDVQIITSSRCVVLLDSRTLFEMFHEVVDTASAEPHRKVYASRLFVSCRIFKAHSMVKPLAKLKGGLFCVHSCSPFELMVVYIVMFVVS